jgi:hypothetical protein
MQVMSSLKCCCLQVHMTLQSHTRFLWVDRQQQHAAHPNEHRPFFSECAYDASRLPIQIHDSGLFGLRKSQLSFGPHIPTLPDAAICPGYSFVLRVRGAQPRVTARCVGPKRKYPRCVGPGYLVPGRVFHSLSRQPVNRECHTVWRNARVFQLRSQLVSEKLRCFLSS